MEVDRDVFISYSHEDKEWVVNTLLPVLNARGLTVCIDIRDFQAGRAAIHNMVDAVKRSRHVVLVLTPAWIKSGWTGFEGLLVRGSDPAGRERRTIPLLLEKCEIPAAVGLADNADVARQCAAALR